MGDDKVLDVTAPPWYLSRPRHHATTLTPTKQALKPGEPHSRGQSSHLVQTPRSVGGPKFAYLMLMACSLVEDCCRSVFIEINDYRINVARWDTLMRPSSLGVMLSSLIRCLSDVSSVDLCIKTSMATCSSLTE